MINISVAYNIACYSLVVNVTIDPTSYVMTIQVLQVCVFMMENGRSLTKLRIFRSKLKSITNSYDFFFEVPPTC